MEKLTEAKLRNKVKNLQGKFVCTIDKCVSNSIQKVTSTEIVRKSVRSPNESSVAWHHVWNTYEYLWKHCQVTHDDLNGKIPENPYAKRVSRIVLAILRACV